MRMMLRICRATRLRPGGPLLASTDRPTSSPPPMTDQRVYRKLLKAGLRSDKDSRQESSLRLLKWIPELSPGSLDALMRAGASGEVIKAMAAKMNGAPNGFMRNPLLDPHCDPGCRSGPLLRPPHPW